MTKNLQSRVARIEAALHPEAWREWEGRPADEWPDAALEGFLRADIRQRGGQPPETFTDADLQAIAAGEPTTP